MRSSTRPTRPASEAKRMYQSNARVVASDLIHAHPLTCSRPAGARTRHCVRTTVVHEAGRTGADVSAGGCDDAGSGLVILRSHHSTDQAVNTRRAVTCATVEAVNGCAYSAVPRAVQRLRMQARRGTCSSGRTVEDGHARTNARPRTHARVRTHTNARTHARTHTHTHTHWRALKRSRQVFCCFGQSCSSRKIRRGPRSQNGTALKENSKKRTRR